LDKLIFLDSPIFLDKLILFDSPNFLGHADFVRQPTFSTADFVQKISPTKRLLDSHKPSSD
jgi:hypothetical protein